MPAESSHVSDIEKRLLSDCELRIRDAWLPVLLIFFYLPRLFLVRLGSKSTQPEICFLGANKAGAGGYRATEGLPIQETGETGEKQRDGAAADLIINYVATGNKSSAFHAAFATTESSDYTHIISFERGELPKVRSFLPSSLSFEYQ